LELVVVVVSDEADALLLWLPFCALAVDPEVAELLPCEELLADPFDAEPVFACVLAGGWELLAEDAEVVSACWPGGGVEALCQDGGKEVWDGGGSFAGG